MKPNDRIKGDRGGDKSVSRQREGQKLHTHILGKRGCQAIGTTR